MRTWEKIRTEDKCLEKEHPDDSYRIVCALKKADFRNPLTLWELSDHLRIFNHRALEAPVLHILKQAPELASYEAKDLKIIFKDPSKASETILGLIKRYEDYFHRDERTKEQEHQKVMERFKVLEADPRNLSVIRW